METAGWLRPGHVVLGAVLLLLGFAIGVAGHTRVVLPAPVFCMDATQAPDHSGEPEIMVNLAGVRTFGDLVRAVERDGGRPVVLESLPPELDSGTPVRYKRQDRVCLAEALRWATPLVCDDTPSAALDYRQSGTDIRLGRRGYFDSKEAVVQIFDLTTLLLQRRGPDPSKPLHELARSDEEFAHQVVIPLLIAAVEHDSWLDGGGELERPRFFGSMLMVTAPRRYGQRIQVWLDEMARHPTPPGAAGVQEPKGSAGRAR